MRYARTALLLVVALAALGGPRGLHASAAGAPAIGQAPARLSLQPDAVFGAGMRCGAGDLDVGPRATVRLDGVHRYAHVCIHDGGVLRTHGQLTLIASTIAVDATSRITADDVTHTRPRGHIAHGGSAGASRAVPPPGAPGTDGTAAETVNTPEPWTPSGGAGGGVIALVANSALVAGTISADGARGDDGIDGMGSADGQGAGACDAGGNGGGGGSGGGIYIRAAALQLRGHISVAGGMGGMGGENDCGTVRAAHGAHGRDGLVRLLVDVLRAPAGALPIVGTVALAQTLPVDPAPPVAVAGAQYVATAGSGASAALIGHSLAGPFLDFYRRHGGLAILGYPRTEVFSDGGHQVQYTERFLLQLDGNTVVTAPLGRQLTAGHMYGTVPAFASSATRRYFATTGHSLSGRFLSFWSSHDGATLLGAPISEVVREQNGDGSGRSYQLQWFEQGRLEYHAELAGTPYALQIGLLGTQALAQRGWLP